MLAEPEIDAMQISAFCVVADAFGVGGFLGTQRFFIIFSRKEGNGHERRAIKIGEKKINQEQ